MVQILERVQAHYESREMLFGKVYEWHPATLALECECGEKVTLSATSSSTTTTTTCSRCGAEVSLARSLGKPVFPLHLSGDARLELLDDVQWVDLADARRLTQEFA